MSKTFMKVNSDFTKQFGNILKSLKKDQVLVGIPETKTERKEDEPINNATILALNQFGSPANNIPPRPVMTIGIKNAQESIAEQYKKALIGILSSGLQALDNYYNRAGIIASNSIKKVINDQDSIEGPAESTLAARRSVGFKGTKSLIVTGQMRNAITYVIQGKKDNG